MLKKYKFGFDFFALLIFVMIMIPNILWFIIPAPNDVLRIESKTGLIDIIASILQIGFVAILCLIIKKDVKKISFTPLIILSSIFILLYFAGWIFYFIGIVNVAIVLVLTIFPCVAFILFAIDRKNFLALIPCILFFICHLIFALVNFIL